MLKGRLSGGNLGKVNTQHIRDAMLEDCCGNVKGATAGQLAAADDT